MKVKVIGLTGGIAAGKSTVAKILQKLGAILIDADEVAKEVMVPESQCWQLLVEDFGPQILLKNGQIDRKKLAQVVFKNNGARDRLNRIAHPFIIQHIKDKINSIKATSSLLLRQQRHKQALIIIVEAALLLDVDAAIELVDQILIVEASKELQVKRLLAKGYTQEQALARISAQDRNHQVSQKPGCDKPIIYITNNYNKIAPLEKEVRKLWQQLKL